MVPDLAAPLAAPSSLSFTILSAAFGNDFTLSTLTMGSLTLSAAARHFLEPEINSSSCKV